MKKLIALLLALALTLSCAAVLAEAPAVTTDEKTDMGTIDFGGKFIIKGKIPEGYTLIEEEKMEHVFINAKLVNETDPTAPYLTIRVFQEETFEPGTRMNDLDEETLKWLESTYTAESEVKIEYAETGLGTKLMQITEVGDDPDCVSFFSVYEGYEIELTIWASDVSVEGKLTDEVIQKAITFLTEMDFIKVDEPAAEAPAA